LATPHQADRKKWQKPADSGPASVVYRPQAPISTAQPAKFRASRPFHPPPCRVPLPIQRRPAPALTG